jgi:hypothetical protein
MLSEASGLRTMLSYRDPDSFGKLRTGSSLTLRMTEFFPLAAKRLQRPVFGWMTNWSVKTWPVR